MALLSALLRSLAGDAVVEAHASEGPTNELAPPLPGDGVLPAPPLAGGSAEKGSEPLEDPLLPEESCTDVGLLLPASASAVDASGGASTGSVDAAQRPDMIAAWQPQGGSTLWEVQAAGRDGSTSRKPGCPSPAAAGGAGAKAAWSPAKASPSKGGSPGKAKLALSKLLCGGVQRTSPTLSVGLEAAAEGSPQR